MCSDPCFLNHQYSIFNPNASPIITPYICQLCRPDTHVFDGLEEKTRITLKFLKRKLAEYEEIKLQIKEITKEVEKDESIDFLSDGTLDQLAQII